MRENADDSGGARSFEDSIARSLPGGSNAGRRRGDFRGAFTYDLPLDYYSTLPDRINA